MTDLPLLVIVVRV